MSARAQRRHADWWASRGRQRGNVAVLFALLLTVLVGVVALVVDLGNGWRVNAELQNATDSAALAGVLRLDGTAAKFPVAIADAVLEANRNNANGSAVNVAGNVVVGQWALPAGPFSPFLAQSPTLINAVQVTSPNTAVQTFFAPVIGINQENVQAHAIAVGGGPGAAQCGFPVAIPSCSILNPDGSLNCQQQLTFNGNGNNAAFTLYLPKAPLDTPALDCMFATAAKSPPANCPKGCDCTACTASNAGDTIWVGNGNNLSKTAVDAIKADVAANQPGGLFVEVPIFDDPTCGGNLSNTQNITGYARIQILNASDGPPKTITLAMTCNQVKNVTPGGGFYGTTATQVYLAQ